MSGLMERLAERIRYRLPHWIPWLPIGLAWWQMITTQLAQASGSGG